MGKMKAAVVGTGWVSGEHLAAFEANPRTEVAAVCGRTRESAEKKLAECGLKANIYTDYERMLDDEEIDIISICTPNHLHAEQAATAAEKKKHILLEKPAALTPRELDEVLEAVRKNRVKAMVSFVLHWNPLAMTIDSMLKDEVVGDIFYAEIDYYHAIGPWYKQYKWNVKKEIGGSSLLSAGCHAIDMLLWFVNRKPVEVFARNIRSGRPEFKDYEYDPTSVAMIRFDNGTIGKITSSLDCFTPYIFNIGLFGSKGTIRNNRIFSHKFPGQTDYLEIPTILPDSGDVTHHPFEGEVDHLVDCILNDGEPFPGLESAAVTHRLIFAADLSAKEGKPVEL